MNFCKTGFILLTAVFCLCFMLCGCKKSDGGVRVLNKGRSASVSSLSGGESENENDSRINFDCQKAIWISYIELAEFLSGADSKAFEERFTDALENAAASGFNTVYVHVRAFGDAYYNSELYPKAAAVEGDFDPLQIMVEASHKLGLSFHAWINPFRCQSKSAIEALDKSFKIKQWYESGDGRIQTVSGNDFYWLNPAYDEVTELICGGVEEIIEGYDVDGIHFDDYFFPTTEESFDSNEFAASGEESLSDFRINEINSMVKAVYSTIKQTDESVLFGLSPQGNIDNDYNNQYADVKRWCSEDGFCDYIVPQVYYGYESSCPYLETIAEWSEMCCVPKLVIGLAEYKILSEEEFISQNGIIANMITDAKELENYSGVAIYNYKNLFMPDEDNSERVMAEKELIEENL